MSSKKSTVRALEHKGKEVEAEEEGKGVDVEKLRCSSNLHDRLFLLKLLMLLGVALDAAVCSKTLGFRNYGNASKVLANANVREKKSYLVTVLILIVLREIINYWPLLQWTKIKNLFLRALLSVDV